MSVYDEVQNLCNLQRLFEMFSFCIDTGTKSWTPLVNRVADDALFQTVPTRQSNATSDRRRVAHSPNKRGPSYLTPCSQQGWGRGCWEATYWDLGAMKAGTYRCSNATVSRALLDGGCTMSCWGMKKSPVIAQISGSISCFSSTSPDNTLHLFWCQGPRIWGG